MESPAEHPVTDIPTHAPQGDGPVRSHTQDNPAVAPHTQAGLSTISTPEPYARNFLLLWAARYLPRGFFGELFDSRTLSWIKAPANSIINKGSFLNKHVSRIEAVMAKHSETVAQLQKGAAKTPIYKQIPDALYEDMRKALHHWRGDASKQASKIIAQAEMKEGAYVLSEASRAAMKDTIRGRLGNMFFTFSLFIGSTALTLNYSRQVRADIINLFRETVALEQGMPQEKVTFADIAKSDNSIIRHTVENYREKRNARLFSDGLLALAVPFKSMGVTDMALGWKGWQMFRDTRHRSPTLFEDLINFVNNKINPTNGLGQPISMGEVFDLYQHYAQAYDPDKAFVGVIEHAKNEGARWSENQVVFERMTELLNKTYAYKHHSIVDPKTGLTELQADFALPKFMYLLGHDLIDVNDTQKTLTRIEVANRYGISAVKEMETMLKQGKTLEAVMKHYALPLPVPQPQVVNDAPNAVIPKATAPQMERMEEKSPQAVPTAKITADSVQRSEKVTDRALSAAV